MINRYELYEDMTDEQLMDLGLSDEQLAQIYSERAVESAKITLQLSENCCRKFGKQLLSDTQKSYFQNVANGILPTDEEQFSVDVEMLKQSRESDKQQSAKLGDAYKPILTFEDKTEGFGVN